MNNEEKALKIAVGTVSERTRNHPSNLPHIIIVKDACIEMAQWKDEQLKQTREDAKSLYNEISDCIDRLIKSRLSKNGIGESNALQQMESIMVKTQQFLTYINEL